MNIIDYTDEIGSIESGHLHGFFVGWPNPPSPETHLRLLRGSDAVIIALEGGSGNVIGFITAVTDGVLAAHIPFLEVLPEFQGRGIGSELMRRMIEKLGHLYAIDLLCDQNLQAYYERFGMRKTFGMAIRNYGNRALDSHEVGGG